ncbi:hypothetical protein [Shewanella marina]|uniref:hypothetical protein n=1 Tax=Shewanella marina TaxID=487319 RepID=UPI000470B589|nr:hypothetical protein [Shewanella marina]
MYYHKQYAKAILVMLGLITVFTILLELASTKQVFWPVYLTIIVIAILFHCLVIEQTEQKLKWHFGLGFFSKHIDFSEIKSASIIEIKWFYGLGIRRTKHGWFYGVSGMQALKLELRNGQVLLLGTDDGVALLNMVNSQIV